MDNKEIACLLKALANEHRIKIMEILSDGERCVCEIQPHFEFSQPTLSHHLSVLVEAQLIHARKEGKWTYYSLSRDRVNHFVRLISEKFKLELIPSP